MGLICPTIPEIHLLSIPAQSLSLQVCLSTELPEHDVPPCKGAGLLHWRVLVFAPSPHVLEQVLHVKLH